jgi:uncharacterized protein (DUF1697 family)
VLEPCGRYRVHLVRYVVLLRGVNLGPRNRVSMPTLRDLLTREGFDDVRTYLQSGNVVLSTGEGPDALAETVTRVIASEFGLDIAIVVRSRDELAEVIGRDPLGDVVTDPKRYQVSFLAAELGTEVVEELERLAVEGEQLVASGRELYAWHPAGIARSRMWNAIASPRLPVTSTARNWSTTTSLLALADE